MTAVESHVTVSLAPRLQNSGESYRRVGLAMQNAVSHCPWCSMVGRTQPRQDGSHLCM